MTISDELIGQVLDEKYCIEQKLGQGGMGAVYRATHIGTKRSVALKVIMPRFMAFPEFVERFKREAEAAGRLRHPNIVNVTDFGFAPLGKARLAYLVMEYLDGYSLGEALRTEGRLPLSAALDILEQICSAIEEAHQQGIIHRDLKPDNIWLQPNQLGGHTVKVLDFGLAKLHSAFSAPLADSSTEAFALSASAPSTLEIISGAQSAVTAMQYPEADPDAPTQIQPAKISDEKNPLADGQSKNLESQSSRAALPELTRAGSILGTPLYMSPEQCRSEQLDASSDVYSLGVIAYQMLSGQTPFSGDLDVLIRKHTKEPPPTLAQKGIKIPEAVENLVMSALSKYPTWRPESAAAFAAALRANAEGTVALLRQAVSLYGQHFPTFIRISVIGNASLIILLCGMFSWMLIPSLNTGDWYFSLYYFFAFLLAADIFNHTINGGIYVPAVAQLLAAPLRSVQIPPLFAALKKRLRAFAATSIYVYGSTISLFLFTASGAVLDSAPEIVKYPLFIAWILLFIGVLFLSYKYLAKYMEGFPLYTHVVIMEGLQATDALARAKELGVRSNRFLKRPWLLETFSLNVILLVGALIWFLLNQIKDLIGAQSLISAKGHIIVGLFAGVLSILLILFFYILTMPIASIFSALVYLKARQAGGETLREMLDQFEGKTESLNK